LAVTADKPLTALPDDVGGALLAFRSDRHSLKSL
jgi:hypothetical protein